MTLEMHLEYPQGKEKCLAELAQCSNTTASSAKTLLVALQIDYIHLCIRIHELLMG